MQRNGYKIAAVLAVMAFAVASKAENLVWQGVAGDSLADPAKWFVQDPWQQSDAAPGADDKIVIGVGCPLTIDASNAADMAVVNGSLGVFLAEVNSSCNIVVPEGTARSNSTRRSIRPGCSISPTTRKPCSKTFESLIKKEVCFAWRRKS